MKRLFLASGMMVCGLALAAPARSANYNFVTLSVPGATPGNFLAVSGINDLGQAIVAEQEPGVSFDYTVINDVYNWHTNTYTPLPAYPGSTTNSTAATDINNAGTVVGYYHAVGIDWGGFTLSGGSFTGVTYPAGSPYTFPIGNSNSGSLAGDWVDDGGSGNEHGFVRIGNTFTSLDVPASWGNETFADDINNAGTAVGGSPPQARAAMVLLRSHTFGLVGASAKARCRRVTPGASTTISTTTARSWAPRPMIR